MRITAHGVSADEIEIRNLRQRIAELEQKIIARDITIKELGRAAKSALNSARAEEREYCREAVSLALANFGWENWTRKSAVKVAIAVTVDRAIRALGDE